MFLDDSNGLYSKQENMEAILTLLYKTLLDAKVKTIDELINKPVEVVFEDKLFREFRILTEVL